MDPRSQPGRESRRLIVVFALGIIIPTFFLSWLSAIAIGNDGAAITRLAEEEARRFAEVHAHQLHLELRDLEAAARAELDLARFRGDLSGSLKALDEQLRAARNRHPIVATWLAVDERRNVLLPAVNLPYQEGGGRKSLPAPATDLQTFLGQRPARSRQPGSDSQTSFQQAILDFEVRRSAERTYSAGEALEIRLEDPASALEVYRELLAGEADPRTRARSLASLARCQYKLGQLPEAAASYAQLAASAGRHLSGNGLPLRVLAHLQRGFVLAEAGAHLESQETLVALAEDMERGQFTLSRAQYEFFQARIWDQFARGQARVAAAADVAAPASQHQARLIEDMARLQAQSRDRARRVALRDQVESEVLPYLSSLLDDPDQPVEGFSHLSRLGERPFLVHYTVVVPPGPAGTRLVVGFLVDLEWFAREIAGQRVQDGLPGPGVSISVVDPHDREVARAGPPVQPGDLSVLVPIEAPLPFWKVRVSRDGRTIRVESRRRVTLYLLIVAIALGAVLVGAWTALRAVLKNMELARLKNDFVSAVTHELKTPLTSIRMFSEMLALGRVRSEEKKAEYFRIIANESERLGTLIDNILDIARLERRGLKDYNFEVVDPHAFAQKALDIFAFHVESKGFRLTAEVPAAGVLPGVRVDRGTMTRALLNILGNAVKYSQESKDISFRVFEADTDTVAFAISDHGAGIPVELREQIFERFFRAGDELTREVPGTGLGLAIVKNIVEAHGGRIAVSGEVGEGSTFTIQLPAVRGDSTPVEDHGDSEVPDGREQS